MGAFLAPIAASAAGSVASVGANKVLSGSGVTPAAGTGPNPADQHADAMRQLLMGMAQQQMPQQGMGGMGMPQTTQMPDFNALIAMLSRGYRG